MKRCDEDEDEDNDVQLAAATTILILAAKRHDGNCNNDDGDASLAEFCSWCVLRFFVI